MSKACNCKNWKTISLLYTFDYIEFNILLNILSRWGPIDCHVTHTQTVYWGMRRACTIYRKVVCTQKILFANISIYCHCIDIFQKVLKYIDVMTVYCGLFHLSIAVLNILNIHIYTVNILRGSRSIVDKYWTCTASIRRNN